MYPRFEQFVKEKQYLQNVSIATLSWYRHAAKWLPCESPDADQLKQMVMAMREAGLKPTGANAAIRAVNVYLKWSGSQHKVPQLKEPEFVLPTFSDIQIKLLVTSKPHDRLHLLVLVLLDSGCRISEALGLQWSDVDWDNCLLTLHGKGRKDRLVPFSHELRKALWRQRGADPCPFLWRFDRSSALRRVKTLCRRLGFAPPRRTLHAFRHTFALNYVRRGGSVFHLQKALGHSDLEMSRRYVSLQTGDMVAAHRSLLCDFSVPLASNRL
ncbi:MAG TPA: site-specific integrase [Candidatus Acidoferrum sp.]|nr:site-specific integrase [Candidatus Acidoferrum sp.]